MSLRSFHSVSVGDVIPSIKKVVTREDIAAYAEASHDMNPLHIDDAHARARGYDGVIGHGMFTMAHLTTCITEWAGDPDVLVQVKANFRAAVKPGDEMVAGGEVTSVDPATKTAKLDVWVSVELNAGTEYPIKRSHAIVQLG